MPNTSGRPLGLLALANMAHVISEPAISVRLTDGSEILLDEYLDGIGTQTADNLAVMTRDIASQNEGFSNTIELVRNNPSFLLFAADSGNGQSEYSGNAAQLLLDRTTVFDNGRLVYLSDVALADNGMFTVNTVLGIIDDENLLFDANALAALRTDGNLFTQLVVSINQQVLDGTFFANFPPLDVQTDQQCNELDILREEYQQETGILDYGMSDSDLMEALYDEGIETTGNVCALQNEQGYENMAAALSLLNLGTLSNMFYDSFTGSNNTPSPPLNTPEPSHKNKSLITVE